MGTRGYLVFHRKQRRVVIYNHYDSYPRSMGAELFRQLCALLERFGGNTQEACRCWGEGVEGLATTYVADTVHPFNSVHAFDNIEQGLQSTMHLIVSEEECLDEWIEFVWTLDLNEGALKMISDGGHAEWPFFLLYRGRALSEQWIAEAENVAYKHYENDSNGCKQPFTEAVRLAAAVAIQASARRFLEVSRGLRPGGLLVRLAAARFRRSCEAMG